MLEINGEKKQGGMEHISSDAEKTNSLPLPAPPPAPAHTKLNICINGSVQLGVYTFIGASVHKPYPGSEISAVITAAIGIIPG